MRGTLELTVLTPTLVGSGKPLSVADYAVVNGRFFLIDWERLVSADGFSMERFLHAFGRGNRGRLEQVLPLELLERTSAYSAELGPDANAYLSRSGADVLAAVRTAGRPYVPGSSLKGAIRTAVLDAAMVDQKLGQVVGPAVRSAVGLRQEFLTAEAERRVFGRRPNDDALRALRVSDSVPLPPASLRVMLVRVLNLVWAEGHLELRWRAVRGGGARSVNDAMAVAVEVLRPGTKVRMDITLDTWLVDQGRLGPAARFLGDLEEAVRNRGQVLVDSEIAFYRQYGEDAMVRALEKVDRQIRSGIACLPVGWGAGWRAHTVGERLESLDLKAVRERYGLGRPGMPFPKTRKVVVRENQAVAPLGWVHAPAHA